MLRILGDLCLGRILLSRVSLSCLRLLGRRVVVCRGSAVLRRWRLLRIGMAVSRMLSGSLRGRRKLGCKLLLLLLSRRSLDKLLLLRRLGVLLAW